MKSDVKSVSGPHRRIRPASTYPARIDVSGLESVRPGCTPSWLYTLPYTLLYHLTVDHTAPNVTPLDMREVHFLMPER